jgi:uncharacterized protein YodC (DUF2158 family)
MAKVTFGIGDVVQLKSGGPLMTVEAVSEDNVTCVWNDKEDQILTQTYNRRIFKTAPASDDHGGGASKGGKPGTDPGFAGDPNRLEVKPAAK